MPYAVRKRHHYFSEANTVPPDGIVYTSLSHDSAIEYAERMERVCRVYLLSHGESARPHHRVININNQTFCKRNSREK